MRYTTAEPEKDQPSPSTLLPTGVYRASTSRCCWCALTAPLHPYLCPQAIGGMFLWHSPHGHPHWALPSKSDLSGARTFLKLPQPGREQPATACANSFLGTSLAVIPPTDQTGWRRAAESPTCPEAVRCGTGTAASGQPPDGWGQTPGAGAGPGTAHSSAGLGAR